MNTLDHEQARQYLHLHPRELGAVRQAALDEHLATCAECRAYAERLAALRPRLSRALHARWDADRPRLGRHSSIQPKLRRQLMRTRTFNFVGSLIGLGALVLLAVLFGWVLSNQSGPVANPAEVVTPTSAPLPTGEATLVPTSIAQLESGPTGLIAFQSCQGETHKRNCDIYVMNADGSQQTNITNDLAQDEAPAWSPDGQLLAFFSDRTGKEEIYLINAVEVFNGTGETSVMQLSHSSEGARYAGLLPPVWSPDGEFVAAVAAQGETYQIDVIRADGAGNTTIFTIHSANSDAWPDLQWSPDGRRLAFALERGNMPGVYVIDISGPGPVRITDDEENIEAKTNLEIAWSPDGKRLAYLVQDEPSAAVPAGRTRLTIFEPDIQKKMENIAPALADIVPTYMSMSAWSPDGAYLAFSSNNYENGCSLIQLLHLDDAAVTPLRLVCEADSWFGGVPQWSPDGQWLVFQSAHPEGTGRVGGIVMINIAGALRTPGNVVPNYLATDPYDKYPLQNPRWQPAPSDLPIAMITPTPTPITQLDGPTGLIAFESDRDGNSEIYVMKADGSRQTNITNDPASDVAPAWSPDGQRLAFFSDRSGQVQVCVINAVDIFNGTADASVTQITQAVEPQEYDLAIPPSWSPDGARLAAFSVRTIVAGTPGQIEIIQADGSGSTSALFSGGVPAGESELHWSPDGQHLAIAQDTEITVFTPDGRKVMEVADGENTEAGYQTYLGIAWSPDGKRLAYLSEGPTVGAIPNEHLTGEARPRLSIFDLDSEAKTIDIAPSLADIPPAGIRGLAWSPDGAYLAFLGEEHTTCWVIRLLRLQDAVVTTLRPQCHYASYFETPQWSPDGQWLVFTSVQPQGSSPGSMIMTMNMAQALDGPDNVTLYDLNTGPGQNSRPQWQP